MSETNENYSVNKMELAKNTVIVGRENRLINLKRQMEIRMSSLKEHLDKGMMDWVANDSKRLAEDAAEAYLIEKDLRELREMFTFLETEN